jgi:hypothetical protein
MTSVKKSRATLIGVILAFLIPVIGAKLVLDQRWYEGGVTNRGTMLEPPYPLGDFAQLLPAGWRVALIDQGDCGDACMQGLYAINQLDVALGKETQRVSPVYISAGNSQLALQQVPLVTAIEDAALVAYLSALPPQRIVIIDPWGNVVMHYPIFSNEEQMRAEAKNLLSDLRNLLKLSRIG